MLVFSGINPEEDLVKQAVRQILRWRFAALQNKNPYVALLHSNYFAGNIDLVRQLWSDETVKKITGQDMLSLWKEATILQDKYQNELKRSI